MQPISSYSRPVVYAHRALRGINQEELLEIVEKMRDNTVVMLNLEDCTEADVDKITTFLNGASCFQQGDMRKSGSHNYILSPPNVEIDSNQEPSRSSFLP